MHRDLTESYADMAKRGVSWYVFGNQSHSSYKTWCGILEKNSERKYHHLDVPSVVFYISIICFSPSWTVDTYGET